MDDADLVQRAAALDREAFDAVYERYAARIYDYLWWVLQDREEANYALYDTFLEAAARLHELPDPSKLRPWLFAIASDQALRHQTQTGSGHEDSEDSDDSDEAPPAPPSDAPPEDGAWSELVHAVRGIATDLTPQDRAILDLKFRQALGDEELAEAIGTEPDTAATLVADVQERVEERLGETVVAFLAQKDCPELTSVLGLWDRLDDEQRTIVDTHAQTCPTCGERRRRHIPASALLGASPALAVPDGVSTRILDDVELGAHHGRPWSSRRRGFPPPFVGGGSQRDRRLLALIGAAAAAVVVVGLALFLLQQGDDATQRVSSVGQGTSSSTSSTATTSTTVGTTTSSSTTTPDAGAIGGTATTRASTGSATGSGSGTGSGGSGSGSGSSGGGSGGGSGSGGGNTSTGTTEPAGDTTTTVTEPPATTVPDTSGPTLSGLTVSPSTVRAGGRCTNGDPGQATVSVRATDRSGIASIGVSVAGAGGGRTEMAGSGDTYTAVIGPFESPLPANFDFPAQVIVSAVDGAGNTSATNTGLTLRCTG